MQVWKIEVHVHLASLVHFTQAMYGYISAKTEYGYLTPRLLGSWSCVLTPFSFYRIEFGMDAPLRQTFDHILVYYFSSPYVDPMLPWIHIHCELKSTKIILTHDKFSLYGSISVSNPITPLTKCGLTSSIYNENTYKFSSILILPRERKHGENLNF